MSREKIVVDLFCGGGGGTHAAVRACEDTNAVIKYFIAVNHDPTAIATQKANHPWAKTYCEDVASVKPIEAVPGGEVDLLLAGPECTFHSNAAGERPINDQSRESAWGVLDWLHDLYVRAFIIENVPEFMQWGPLNANGHRNKRLKGATFMAYIEAIKSLGYGCEYRILCAADYGDPTSRARLFILGRRARKVTFPQPTHCDPRKRKTSQNLPLFNIGHDLKPWRAAREIIDWSLPTESIFNRKKPLSANTMKRILAGLYKFGGLKFVLPNEGVFGGNRARSVDEPMPTVTAHRGAGGVVEPFIIKNYGTNDAASVHGPMPTVTAGGTHLGLAEPIPLVDLSAFMVSAGGPDVAPRTVEEPMNTVLTRDHMGLVQSFVLGQQSNAAARSTDEPLPTVATAGAISLVNPYIVGAGGPARAAEPQSVDRPLRTVVGTNARGVVQPYIIGAGGPEGAARPKSVNAPMNTILADNRMFLVQPYVVPTSHNDTRAHDVERPLPTITGFHNLAVVRPFVMAIDQTGSRSGQARSVDMPIGTITAKNRTALVEPCLVAYHGSSYEGGERVRSLNLPFPTVGAGGNQFGLMQPFIVKFYRTGTAVSVDEPLDTICTHDRFALCVPLLKVGLPDGEGLGCVFLDIGFRMFQPYELAAAMSFPADYKWVSSRPTKRHKITKREQVKLVGNAWPGELGRALCRAQLA